MYPSLEVLSDQNITVIIPTRNPNIKTLESLVSQISSQFIKNKYEILIIDDFSDNDIIIRNHTYEIFKLRDSYAELTNQTRNKKQAISLGVEKAKYDYILCFDDDVRLAENFYSSLMSAVDFNKSKFVAGVHKHHKGHNLVSKFASIEQDILSFFSISSLSFNFPTMCNGAFMMFSKTAFQSVGGYQGVTDQSGGDDIFLFHRIFSEYRNQTYYLKSKDCFVSSTAPDTITTLFSQRKRWLSKSFDYENTRIQLLAVVILFANFLPFIFGFKYFALKICIDAFILYRAKKYFINNTSIPLLILFSALYPFYLIMLLVYMLQNK